MSAENEININNNKEEVTAMEMIPKTQQEGGGFTMEKGDDVFRVHLQDGSIAEYKISNQPVDTMTPFALVEELAYLYKLKENMPYWKTATGYADFSRVEEFSKSIRKRVDQIHKLSPIQYWDGSGYYVCTIHSELTRVGVWHYAVEARMMEKVNKPGWYVQYNRIANYHVLKDINEHVGGKKANGRRNVDINTHVSKYKEITIVSETENGVRLLVKHTKTKKVHWGHSINSIKANRNVFSDGLVSANQHILIALEQIYSQEKVIQLAESYPKYMTREDGSVEWANSTEILRNGQLYGFTQSDLYYFGKTKSIKEAFNKAYGKTENNGLTRKAFGGAQTIKHFEELQAAIIIIRMLKLFPREFFDGLTLKWVVAEYPPTPFHVDPETTVHGFIKNRNMNEIDKMIKVHNTFYKKFGVTKIMMQEMQEAINGSRMAISSNTWQYADTLVALNSIPNRNAQRAVINQVKRQKLSVTEIHDYVVAEARKYSGEIKPTKNTPVINSFHGKEILPDVIFVAPKTTEDLYLWGNEQNNCIGTNYAELVAQKQCFIFGFKNKQTQEWIGHARIQYRQGEMVLGEFRGKYNADIEPNMEKQILKWMKDNLSKRHQNDFSFPLNEY